MITLIVVSVSIITLLMVIGLIASRVNQVTLDQEQVNQNKWSKVNYHSTTGCGSRR